MSERWSGMEQGCLETGHISAGEMGRYVQDRLTAEERERIELRLERCGHCLELFMAAVDTQQEPAMDFQPDLPNMLLLEERVVTLLLQEERSEQADRLAQEEQMARNDREQAVTHGHYVPVASEAGKPKAKRASVVSTQEKPYRHKSWLQHPVTHCTIAASITLLLLGTGIFTSFSQKLAEHDQQLMASGERHLPQPPVSPAKGETQAVSWSDKMVDQTGSWLDGLQARRYK